MAELRVSRVDTLPATLEASKLYFVKTANAGEMDLYLTDKDGNAAFSTLTHAQADARIAAALQSFSNIRAATNITDRDAIAATLTASAMILVADASDDSTVTAGAALYLFDHAANTFTKTYEFEGMDVQLNWDNIINKPTSTPAAIDTAVTNSHAHTNKTVLDGITQDATSGNLVYNTVELNGRIQLEESDW